VNIEEYRAMKAEQEQQANEPENTQTEQTEVAPPVETVAEPVVEEEQVSKIKLGDEEYEPSQIEEFKKGYLRQEELTRERLELEQQRRGLEDAVKLLEKVRENPELAQQFEQDIPTINPQVAEIERMRMELNTFKVEKEISDMKAKYPDFDADAVAQVVQEKGIYDLETAYQLSKASKPQETVDINVLREQIKAEVMKEIEISSVPNSLVTSNGGSSAPSTPTVQISDAEIRIAKNMKLTPEEYVVWRDR